MALPYLALSDEQQSLLKKIAKDKNSSLDSEIPSFASSGAVLGASKQGPGASEADFSGALTSSPMPVSFQSPEISSFKAAAHKASSAPTIASAGGAAAAGAAAGGILPAAITAGAQLLGGYFSSRAEAKMRERQQLVEIAMQEAEQKRRAYDTMMQGVHSGLNQQMASFQRVLT